MIKIKNNIFNENNIIQMCINENNNLEIDVNNGFPRVIKNATLEDIEWNYGTLQEAQRKIQKELCTNCYYRDNIINKLEELEEENEKLKELQCAVCGKGCSEIRKELEEENEKLKEVNKKLVKKIDKAIEYINNTDLGTLDKWKLQEILKGE